ncbi:hypothetical protein BCF46_0702 [Litoreibacter meonggei]|uniref:DNA mimic protein DMP19 C-terminal domain-containing protein n=1 Tax=Litoreibacter meonggei TaxID=1049199 RepID=A0A497X5Z6_9RHOB|nr:hypothetical protein [Litoreibacter meonggei]RLJ60501.1 hypothetical protein BCF46_0702 [Litoreibacter meonggei]
MAVLKVDSNTRLKRKSGEPISYQIHDYFEDYFPRPIEQHVRELNQTFPLATLRSQVAAGNMTEGQWLLYTTVCFSGQVLNGGAEQFFSNCPGLIRDAETVLKDWAPAEFLASYKTAASPLLDVIETHAELSPIAQGGDLGDFWKALETADELIDSVAVEEIDTSAYAKNRNEDANNWFTELETKVLDFVEKNPEQFKHLSN